MLKTMTCYLHVATVLNVGNRYKHASGLRCVACVSNGSFLQPCKITVTTDGRRSLEENMRQALLACYREYSELLKGLGIAQVASQNDLSRLTCRECQTSL